jgi:hypothetical protein
MNEIRDMHKLPEFNNDVSKRAAMEVRRGNEFPRAEGLIDKVNLHFIAYAVTLLGGAHVSADLFQEGLDKGMPVWGALMTAMGVVVTGLVMAGIREHDESQGR